MTANRRNFFGVVVSSILAAPAIVNAASLMPISPTMRVPFFRRTGRFPIVIERTFPDLAILHPSERMIAGETRELTPGVQWATTPGGIFVAPLPDRKIPKLSAPRMTLAEIGRWNRFRSHTGMVMRVANV